MDKIEETTIQKIERIRTIEKELCEKHNTLYAESEKLTIEKSELIVKYLKEEKLLSLMTWIYSGEEWKDNVCLTAKEDWNECPQKIIKLLEPDYHDGFYFFDVEYEGVKLGLHFDDGDIHITLEMENNGDKEQIAKFLKEWEIKVEVGHIQKQVEELQEKINNRQLVLDFFKSE